MDGEHVFLDYSQSELNEVYDQRVWASNWREILGHHAQLSAQVRAEYPPQVRQYGNGQRDNLDIFIPEGASKAPIIVFIHGGAWRSQSKDDVSAPAPIFTNNGCIYVAIDFAVIPQCGLADMVSQCRRALLWVAGNATRFGGDPAQIYVCGHSSGGHLCAMMLATDWASFGGRGGLIKGGVVLSGMYDLHPVLLSSRGSYLRLNKEQETALSPMRHMSLIRCPVLVAWGDKESPEFVRQSRVFAEALSGMGQLHDSIVLETTNHFEVMDKLLQIGQLTDSILSIIN